MAARHLTDARSTEGTTFGQSATDLISFYNATPIVKAVHIDDATDAGTALTQINLILAALETYGLLATS